MENEEKRYFAKSCILGGTNGHLFSSDNTFYIKISSYTQSKIR